MKTHPLLPTRFVPLFVPILLLAVNHLQAQFGPGGQGFGGFGGNANRQNRSTTRQYPANGTVGDATISIAPDSRSLIIVADEPTREYISQVVSNLDRPKPQ